MTREVRGSDLHCAQQVDLVTDYLEGSADTLTAARIDAHLAQCVPCHAYVGQMRQTVTSLAGVPSDGLSAPARSAVLAAFVGAR